MLLKHVVVIQPGNGNILNHCSKDLYLKRAAAVLPWLLSHISTVFQKQLVGPRYSSKHLLQSPNIMITDLVFYVLLEPSLEPPSLSS